MRNKASKRNGQPIDLVVLGERGLLPELLEHYIMDCIKRGEQESRRKRVIPNLAGFCRFCGIGRDEVERLRTALPSEHDALLSVFEDEALNSEMSASVLAYYMKFCLSGEAEEDCGEGDAVIRFEHDILEDGK